MKHHIDAKPGSEEFRNQFINIRNAFISKIELLAAEHKITVFRVCNVEGIPIDWIWDDQEFRYAHAVGTLGDAKNFAAHMIDEGMQVAILCERSNQVSTMWLTSWEEADMVPVWPRNTLPRATAIHEGILVGRPGPARPAEGP